MRCLEVPELAKNQLDRRALLLLIPSSLTQFQYLYVEIESVLLKFKYFFVKI